MIHRCLRVEGQEGEDLVCFDKRCSRFKKKEDRPGRRARFVVVVVEVEVVCPTSVWICHHSLIFNTRSKHICIPSIPTSHFFSYKWKNALVVLPIRWLGASIPQRMHGECAEKSG